MANPASPLSEAALRISEELNRKPQFPMVMDGRAVDKLEVVHGQYLGDVGEEAVRIARRAGLSTVDSTHVVEAAELVIALQSRNRKSAPVVINTLGGLFGGAGLASAYALAFASGPHSPTEQVVGIALCVLGSILLTAGTVMELSKRSR